jgi:hypothetical protein
MTNRMKGLKPQNRPITAEEHTLIKWLLHHGIPGSEQFLTQVGSLMVVSKCECGCPTVNFLQEGVSIAHAPEHILADYLATVNGEGVGVILFQRGGRLSSLEVYSQAGTDKPFGLPKTETIYPYEELSERQKKQNPHC